MSFRFPQLSYRWVIVGCCTVAYAVSFLVRWSYAGLAPFISEDLHLDKVALGLLGGAFFYPYALAQIPWGWLADRIGGRYIIAGGVLLSAVGLACFATAVDVWTAIVWRMLLGLVAATAFVPIASLLARWFSVKDRGVANGIYYGFGGGFGQGVAFLLMPLLSVYVLQNSSFPVTGWRGSVVVIALLLGFLGVLCFVFLRSFPSPPIEQPVEVMESTSLPSTKEGEPSAFSRVYKDPVLWLLAAYFSFSLIALRLVPAWISLYASDVYRLEWSFERDVAVIAGGGVGVLYTVGHIVGSPLLGKLSDWLMRLGVQRLLLPSISLGVGGLSVSVFLFTIPSPYLLGVVSVFLGIVLHAFPIINAVVSERWGVAMTGQSLGGINMVGQLVGALALSASGYLGMVFSSNSADPLSEYHGIWYGVMGCGICGAMCGGIAYWNMSFELMRGTQPGNPR
ncbi:MAG: MFS transporter [Nitrospirales bacterium]